MLCPATMIGHHPIRMNGGDRWGVAVGLGEAFGYQHFGALPTLSPKCFAPTGSVGGGLNTSHTTREYRSGRGKAFRHGYFGQIQSLPNRNALPCGMFGHLQWFLPMDEIEAVAKEFVLANCFKPDIAIGQFTDTT
jgi:hypothetical protein